MVKEYKTLLTRVVQEGDIGTLPERTSYEIISSGKPGMQDLQTNYVYAEKFNEADYLIIDFKNLDDEKQPLSIVNENYTEMVVLSRMYEEARSVAELRAKLDGNKLYDLTGMEKVQG